MKSAKIMRMFAISIFLFGISQIGMAKNSNTVLNRVQEAIDRYYLQTFEQTFEISVKYNGVVEIKGKVPTLYDKNRIYDIVSKVNGVSEIK